MRVVIIKMAPLAKVTTATNKQQRLTTSTETLTSVSPSSLSSTLPFELVQEILYRLPVNSLLQLRCVCKSWNSLISDPNFAKNHLRRLRRSHFTGSHLMMRSANDSSDELVRSYPLSSVFNADSTGLMLTPLKSYSLNIGRHYSTMVGSCDGILCFAINFYCDDPRPPFLLVWNPSISKSKVLPPLENQPRISNTSYGFGYDHLTDAYKVVAVFYYKCADAVGTERYKTRVEVHTLGTNSWRRIQEFPGNHIGVSGIFVNGTLNWLVYTFSGIVIISLDLGKETYQEILQPDYGNDFVDDLTLGVLRDCLCIFSQCCNYADSGVWIMKEYGKIETWTKLFSLSGYFLIEPKALYISEDDDVLLETQSSLGHIAMYNSRNDTFKFLGIQGYSCLTTSVVYMETLISPYL